MSSRPFRQFSLGVLGYTLAVILWGAYVRATGAGAGCGNHWPLCDGEMIPRAASVERMVEFSHRLTSGLALLAVVVLAVWAFRTHPKGHAVRRTSAAAVVFMLLEAAIGAGLVLLELVALDASSRRPIAMSLHLVNTFLLLSALAGCAYHAYTGDGRLRREGPVAGWILSAQLLLVAVGCTGGVAALGDTLARHGVSTSFAQLLLRLRVSHPVVALVAFAVAAFAASAVHRDHPRARTWVRVLIVLLLTQLVVGVLNVALQAPVWIQLVHLLLADGVWLALALCGRTALTVPGQAHAPAVPATATPVQA